MTSLITKGRVAVSLLAVLAITIAVAGPRDAHAVATIEAPFDASYSVTNLGSVPSLPGSYGGLTFLAGDPNTILIGGDANDDPYGALYSIGVVRGAGNHITGFSGTATFFADAIDNDGGVAYGPGDVLFLARYSDNEVGQTKPGSSVTDKVVDLSPLGVAGSPGGLNFVPAGFPGAGQLKLTDYIYEDWYTLTFAADGSGTFDITSATLEVADFATGPEGFAFVPPGSPGFPSDSLILSEYGSNAITTFQLNANGNPIAATRDEFITGLNGPEGAVFDPLTGDFLFSEYDGTEVFVVQGFAGPEELQCVDLSQHREEQGIACISLEPKTGSNTVGDIHTVTATVTTDDGQTPLQGIDLYIFVIDGPNAGERIRGVTDADGKLTLTYTGDGGVGTDQMGTEACLNGCGSVDGFIDGCVADPDHCVDTFFNNPTCGGSVGDQYICDNATKDWTAAVLTAVQTPTPTVLPATLPITGFGDPGDPAGSSGFPWTAAIAAAIGAIALMGVGAVAVARRRM
jgi:hypothetical protein